MKKSEIVFIENLINISTKYKNYTNNYERIIINLKIKFKCKK